MEWQQQLTEGTMRRTASVFKLRVGGQLAGTPGNLERQTLLGGLAAEASLLQRAENFLVVEVARDFKGLCVLHRGMALHAGNGFERVVHRADAFAAAEMDTFDLQRLHFLSFGAAVVRDFNA